MTGTPDPQLSLWQRRSDALRSLSFNAIADELNARRLTHRRARQGPEALLPGHERADAGRMKRVLQALHRRIGRNRSWSIRVDLLALDLGLTTTEELEAAKRARRRLKFNTIRRALRDLCEASVVGVTPRPRSRRVGGQGPNEYLIVWPTVVDLAHGQGFQPSLFDDGALAIAGSDRPDESSGREHPTSVGTRAPTVGTRAPTVGTRAPTVGTRAPIVGARGYPRGPESGNVLVDARTHAGTGARALPPPTRPPHTPSSPPYPPHGPGEEEEEEGAWKLLQERLRRFGLGTANATTRAARQGGWSPAQVGELLDTLERRTLNGVRPWNVGAVWWQLHHADPGAAITLPESEAWRREKIAQQARTPDPQLAASIGPEADAARAEALAIEAEFGDAFAQLTRDQLSELAQAASVFIARHFRTWSAGTPLPASLRLPLLREFAKRQTEAAR